MIAYFPAPYPDELLYSQLARYYVKSGYLAYTYAAQDLFVLATTKPDIEFINTLHPETLRILTSIKSIEKIILHHTMFPYYGRFINKERRQAAFHALISMEGNYRNLLPIPGNKCSSLRYCPICATADRAAYGETYWHRIHQFPGICICPIHHCNLINTNISISSEGSPTLITAEETSYDSGEVQYSGNQLDYTLASYVAEVFHAPMDLDTDVPAGKYLQSRLIGTRYLSQRGAKRNMELMFSDFTVFYQSIPHHPLHQKWQLGKVFSNSRHNLYEICMVAMFLNISPSELTNMILPDKSPDIEFDETIFTLHTQGWNYQQIARQMNAPYDLVKAIGERRYGTYRPTSAGPTASGNRKKDWKHIDQARLASVYKIISEIHSADRPQRITVGLIERKLGLSKGGLRQCPLCLEEIQKHAESQEEYWTREIIWATKAITQNGHSLNVTQIKRYTNLRQKNLIVCLPYMQAIAQSDSHPDIKIVLKLLQAIAV